MTISLLYYTSKHVNTAYVPAVRLITK